MSSPSNPDDSLDEESIYNRLAEADSIGMSISRTKAELGCSRSLARKILSKVMYADYCDREDRSTWSIAVSVKEANKILCRKD